MTRASGGTQSGRSRWIACALIASAAAHATEPVKPAGRTDQSGPENPEPEPPIVLPPVMVTGFDLASGVPVVPLDAIGSRDVFGPTQVRETGAREINDLVQYIPAISTRPYNGGEASAPSFSMRGLPDDGLTEYINVLIDGVPASPMPYGWTAFSFLPVTPDRLFAVDYIRGAHSVRYSPNTVGGVLNFLTLPIPETPSATARSTFGDYDDFDVYYDGTYNNLGEITAEGVDFALEWDAGRVWEPLTGLSLFGGVTLQNSELGSGPYAGNDVPYAWHEKASWRVRYARWGWSATLGGTYVGDSYSDEANTSTPSADGRLGINPDRVIWDARLAKLITLCANADLELALGASNLFDQDWYVHSRGGFFGPGLAAGPPRQIYGSLGLHLAF